MFRRKFVETMTAAIMAKSNCIAYQVHWRCGHRDPEEIGRVENCPDCQLMEPHECDPPVKVLKDREDCDRCKKAEGIRAAGSRA
jgi:hypothetical protein